MSFFEELRRRNVFRAGIAYIVVAWLMLQVADVILGNIQAPDWIFKVILLVLAIGFPLVLVFAWAFELTAEGLKRDADLDHPESVPVVTGRQLDFAIIAVLVIALGYFAYDKFVLSSAGPDKSIAVLPFENTSSDPEQDFFSDGLSEELLSLLAKIPVLRVIARTSSFAYKGTETDVDDISRELNVSHLLDGSVQKANSTVRITAQLIRVNDRSVLWSESYDRELNNIFAIQDEIAAAVVAQLKIRLLGGVPTTKETDPEAYSLYLRARALSRQTKEKAYVESNDLYSAALDIDADYAAAWAGLAENRILQAERVLVNDVADAFDEGRKYAKKALEIDPDYALARASLGRIAMVYDHDLAAAAKHLERALELDPSNPEIIRRAATLLTNLQRLDEAIGLIEYGVARDPISSGAYTDLALANFSAGHQDEAIDAYRTALSLSPDAIGLHSFLGEALLAKGEPADALAAMELEPSEPWRLIGLAMAYHALGKTDESNANLDAMITGYQTEWPYNIAYVFAYRGEATLAFDWLEKARQANDPGLSEIVSAPEFENIRSDPRWLPFLESIGKTPEHLAEVEFKITR